MPYAWTVTNALSTRAAGDFTWTSGPADATRLNMRDRRMGKQFVCNAAASGNILAVDFGVATSLKGWAFLNHNLASFGGAVTVQIQGADDAAFTVNLLNAKTTTTLDFTKPHAKDFVLQFPALSRRYWRIVFGWTGTKTLKVGEVFAYSSATTLSRRDIWGSSGEGHEHRLAQVDSQNLESVKYLLAGPQRSKRLIFSDVSASERVELEALFYATAGINPVLFILEQNESSAAATEPEQDVMFAFLELPNFDFNFSDFSRFSVPTLVLRNLGREVGA
jgi:hypothetical protein